MFLLLCERNCERESQSHVVACVRVHESLEPVGYNNLTFLCYLRDCLSDFCYVLAGIHSRVWPLLCFLLTSLGSEAHMSEQAIVMLFNGLWFKVCGPAQLWFCLCSYFQQVDTWPCHFCLGSKKDMCVEMWQPRFLLRAFWKIYVQIFLTYLWQHF